MGKGTERRPVGRGTDAVALRLAVSGPTGAALLKVVKAAAIKAEAKECIFERIVGVSGETVGCLGRPSDKRRQGVDEEYQLVDRIIYLRDLSGGQASPILFVCFLIFLSVKLPEPQVMT